MRTKPTLIPLFFILTVELSLSPPLPLSVSSTSSSTFVIIVTRCFTPCSGGSQAGRCGNVSVCVASAGDVEHAQAECVNGSASDPQGIKDTHLFLWLLSDTFRMFAASRRPDMYLHRQQVLRQKT